MALNWENKTRVSKEIANIKEELEKQSRDYWNLMLTKDNWNIGIWFTAIVITLEIAKGKLMYGMGICKILEGCTWNKT